MKLIAMNLLLMLRFSTVSSFASRRLPASESLAAFGPSSSDGSSGSSSSISSHRSVPLLQHQQQRRFYSRTALCAKPKRGSIVDSYRTISVNCSKCRERLFRYKKKNGTKSNLIKCYVERIAEDSAGVFQQKEQQTGDDSSTTATFSTIVQDLPLGHGFDCPNCGVQFARSAQIHGLPALKMVGGKVSMTKK